METNEYTEAMWYTRKNLAIIVEVLKAYGIRPLEAADIIRNLLPDVVEAKK